MYAMIEIWKNPVFIYHKFGGTLAIYKILDVSAVSVLFVTEEILGQIHLHLLSS